MIYYHDDGLVIRDAVPNDIEEIAINMRRQDAEEAAAAVAQTPSQALAGGLAASTLCLTAERHGVPLAMFGVVPDALLGSRAIVWMLGAEPLGRIKKTFVRVSRKVIAMFLERYPELYNYVDARYAGSVRWLKSCGAVFEDPVGCGVRGEAFQRFVLRRS